MAFWDIPDWLRQDPWSPQFEYFASDIIAQVEQVNVDLFSIINFVSTVLVPTVINNSAAIAEISVDTVPTIAETLAEVSSATADAEIFVAAAVTAETTEVVNGFAGFWSSIQGIFRVLYLRAKIILETVWSTIAHVATVVYEAFKEFLEAIHFKTIMKVHQILMFVSSAYRNMMKKVYRAIFRISEAVGLGASFFSLALRNSRNLILDITTLMGGHYDVAQLTWLRSMNTVLNRIQAKANQYKNDPEEFFHDLEEIIDKPTMDAKGDFAGGFLTTLENASKTAATIADQFGKIGVDVANLVNDLPPFIKNQIPDVIPQIGVEINDFVQQQFNPAVQRLNNLVDQLNADKEQTEAKLGTLVDRLKNPGDYLKEIEQLTPEDRYQARLYVSDVAFSPAIDWNTMLNTIGYGTDQEYNTQIETPYPTAPPPQYLTFEIGSPTVIPPGALLPRDTWFVGDY